MKDRKFWNFAETTDGEGTKEGRTLFIEGIIAEESWFDDEVSPKQFKAELESGEGDLTVVINSCGGDCFAASKIYAMLCEYKGKVTAKIEALAASAASVIAMAADEVLMSAPAIMMIHNPTSVAAGDHIAMKAVIGELEEVKEGIINAYRSKTGLSRAKISALMDDTTWMNARKAIALGFADGIIDGKGGGESTEESETAENAVIFSQNVMNRAILNKMESRYQCPAAEDKEEKEEHSLTDVMNRLETIKKYI